MTAVDTEPEQDFRAQLVARTLPSWAPWAVAAASVGASVAFFGLVGFSIGGVVIVAALVYTVGMTLVTRAVEGPRRSTDRLVTILVTGAFGIALVPLISVIWTVMGNGTSRFDGQFFTSTMRNVLGEGGGASQAIIGTLLITALTTLISVPLGLLTAIYLVEYGRGRLARAITFLVDVMTGIPSIVAGLFAYALFVLVFGPGVRMGAAGAVALTVLMTPVVVRSSEEMLKIVPNELREAAFALGVPRWLTITKVVLPTAIAGIATGVTLAIARVIGETAPLLVAAGFTQSTNTNLFSGRMATLPVYAYYQYTQPGIPPEFGIERAWSAALTLIVIVMGLNLVARLISRLFAPKLAR